RDVLGLWPSHEDLARDIELPGATVRSWHRRDNVPLAHWRDLLASAKARGIRHLTTSRLTHIAQEAPSGDRRCKTQRAQCVPGTTRVAQGTSPPNRQRHHHTTATPPGV